MQPFLYLTKICLRDTDATGVLYFADQFRIALEALEAFLEAKGYSLRQILDKGDFLLPIVHAEGDYFAPLRVGDPLKVLLYIKKIGNSSLTLEYELYDTTRDLLVGKVSIVHVTISKETNASIPIPPVLKTILATEGP